MDYWAELLRFGENYEKSEFDEKSEKSEENQVLEKTEAIEEHLASHESTRLELQKTFKALTR